MEYELTNIIYDNSEYELEIETENIKIQDFSLEELTVLPSREQQVITPTQPKTYYNKVIVEPVVTEDIVTQSSNKDKLIIPLVGTFFNRVWVKGDSNLVSENIKDGVSILGVSGSLSTKYSPSFISFANFEGTDLTEELSNLDTSNIQSMYRMFYNCRKLTSLDISNFNTENIIEIANMFGYCQQLRTLNLGNINTKNVDSLQSLFYECNSLENIDLSSFNTEKVISIRTMFFRCSSLTKIDISSFSSASLIDTTSAFNQCNKLTTLIINNPNLFKMTNTSMLRNTPIEKGTGYVYVPDDMVETYKSATNWSTYANQIKGMSELPEGV